MIGDIEKGLTYFGQHQNQLSQLERDLEVKQNLYTELLERYEMAQITGSLGEFEQDKRVKIIDQPYTPIVPANLSWPIYMIIGLFAGLSFGT